MKNYNIAISVSNKDKWIAKEIYLWLKNYSISVFFYDESKDIKGKLIKKLETIFTNSILDVVIITDSYIKSNSEYLLIEKNIIMQKYQKYQIFPLIVIFDFNEENFKNNNFVRFIKPFEWLFLTKDGFKKIIDHILDLIMNNHYILRHNFCSFYHPYGVKNRITIDFVKFNINKNYKDDYLQKWNKLGDILIKLDNISLNKECYLIPSRKVPPFLSNSVFLKTNKTALTLKKKLSENFINKHINKTLSGVLIFITNNGDYYPYVYCDDFDYFLINNYQRYFYNPFKGV